MYTIIFCAVLGVCAAIGLIVGLVKGFLKVQTWASDYAISAAVTVLVGVIMSNYSPDPKIGGIVVLACAIVCMMLCVLCTGIIKKALLKSFQKRDENLKKYGGVGVFNRIFGGITLMIKGAVIAFLILSIPLAFIDMTRISLLADPFAELFASGFWNFVKAHILDLIAIGFLHMAIRHGFSTGIASAVWGLLILGLIVGAGYISYYLVFKGTVFNGFSAQIADFIVQKTASSPLPEGMAAKIAPWVITAGLFVILAVIIGLVSVLISRVITFARVGATFYIVDGIAGAIVMFVIVAAILLLIGNILQTFEGMEFMAYFNTYLEKSCVAKAFYGQNLLNLFGFNVIPAGVLQ